MKGYRYRQSGIFLMILFMNSITVAAEQAEDANDVQQLRREMQQLRDQMQTMRKQHQADIQALQKQLDQQAQKPSGDPQQRLDAFSQELRSSVATGGGTPGITGQAFNPKISVNGDFLFHEVNGESGESDGGNEDRFQVREVEMYFTSPIDPFSRADFNISLGEEDGELVTDLEEGFVTFLDLPWDATARVGKFRTRFGRANTYHTHQRPWIDSPAITENYFGEEGMSEEGGEFSFLLPGNEYRELVLMMQNNKNDASFAGSEADDFLYALHLKNFHELDDESTLQWGVSYATAPNNHGHGGQRTHLEGFDLTYKKQTYRGGTRGLIWQNEFLLSQKDQAGDSRVDSWGLYSSLVCQFSKSWSVYSRYDYSEFPNDNDSYIHAYTAGVQFNQSEFAYWRLAGKLTTGSISDDDDISRNELLVQYNISIGPHPAHEY